MIKGNLTKEEAYLEMTKGNKISHTYFGDDEYVYLDGKTIMSEDGYNFDEWWLREANEISKGIEKPWRIYESNNGYNKR